MSNLSKYSLTGILLWLFCLGVKGQLIVFSKLDSIKIFYSIQDALQTPDSVYKLDLSKNKLKEFPQEVFEFKNLNWLNLSKNKLSTIPANIKDLTYLQDLNLTRNRLDTLPEEIFELNNLKVFRAAQNNIGFLSPKIKQLQQLEILDLWSNNFDDFPEELNQLTALKVLDLRVILLRSDVHQKLLEWLPQTKIYLSPPCNSCLE